MAENKVPKQVNSDRNNPRRFGKICEYLTYSGKEAFKRLRTSSSPWETTRAKSAASSV